MSTVTIRPGDLVEKDPADIAVYTFDWDTDNLPPSVIISASRFKIRSVGTNGDDIDQAVTSITRSVSTATVTTAAAHGYTTGDSITVAGADQAEYNGTFAITVTGTTTFTYTLTGTPATPATGTITVAEGLDSCSILSSGSYGSRSTQCRFTGGTLGAIYEISNTIVTNESPAQTKERSFRVAIADL